MGIWGAVGTLIVILQWFFVDQGNKVMADAFRYAGLTFFFGSVGYVLVRIAYGTIHGWKFNIQSYKIPKGKRRDWRYFLFGFDPVSKTKLRFGVRFSKGSEYKTDTHYLSTSVNKLGGICLLHPHKNSSRIGFSYNSQLGFMMLHTYKYKDGVREIGEGYPVPWDHWVRLEVDIEKLLDRKIKWWEKFLLFRNYPMFGGIEKAPNDIKFLYQLYE